MERLTRAAFGGPVVDGAGVGLEEGVDREATLTIAPPPLSTIAVIAARLARRAMKRFICIADSNSSSLVPKKPSARIRNRADVVNQNVNSAVLVDRALNQPPRAVRSGEIQGHAGDAPDPVEVGGGRKTR